MIKKILAHLISKMSPSMFFAIAYIHNRKRVPHFKHPRDLSEIWIKSILDGKPREMYWLADKYRVREFVKERGLADILVPLMGGQVWDKCPSKEEIGSLPPRFALKMNYGAGMNLVCSDKDKFDVDGVMRKIQEWFARPTNYSYSESHYNLIERKLICEAYIEDHHGGFPTDYKFMCFHGKPFCVLACTGRESGNADYMPFTLDWKPLPEYTKNGDLYEIPKPKELDKMINIATKLADGLDLVRVDLYDTGTKIYFGEMTLTPAGAIFHNWSQKALDDMGAFYYKTMKK